MHAPKGAWLFKEADEGCPSSLRLDSCHVVMLSTPKTGHPDNYGNHDNYDNNDNHDNGFFDLTFNYLRSLNFIIHV